MGGSPMKALLTALALLASALTPVGARGSNEADIRATYEAFAAAQNARDLDRVRAPLIDSPRFLWVSDGMSVWGLEATLAPFQEAPVWRVERSSASISARRRTAWSISSMCTRSAAVCRVVSMMARSTAE